jgi:hypothetical protein
MSLVGGVPPPSGRSGTAAISFDTVPSGVAKKASNQLRLCEKQTPRRHSCSEVSRFFLRSCATRAATQKRRQAIDLTAFFMVAGERSHCRYANLSSYFVIPNLTPAAA